MENLGLIQWSSLVYLVWIRTRKALMTKDVKYQYFDKKEFFQSLAR